MLLKLSLDANSMVRLISYWQVYENILIWRVNIARIPLMMKGYPTVWHGP